MDEEISADEFGMTPELFSEWRSPRFGRLNPTRMDNKVWEWLIRTRISAYEAAQEFKDVLPASDGPTWSFYRFGQTATEMPDGRIIYIGGEHEDHYDPDFCIYNDVAVVNPNDSIEIYGYPEEVFPPTDFHTATLVGESIVIIGSLGYLDKREHKNTQVCVLDTNSYEIEIQNTSGELPGWIHDHEAHLVEDETYIVIEKGKIDGGDKPSLVENIDDWRLNLKSWKWERLTKRNWVRWEILCPNTERNHIWWLRQALWYSEAGWKQDYEEYCGEIIREIGLMPDLELLKTLYNPQIPHQVLPEREEEYGVYRILVNGVVVRFVENMFTIQVTVEGELPDTIIRELKKDLLTKLSILENTACEIFDI